MSQKELGLHDQCQDYDDDYNIKMLQIQPEALVDDQNNNWEFETGWDEQDQKDQLVHSNQDQSIKEEEESFADRQSVDLRNQYGSRLQNDLPAQSDQESQSQYKIENGVMLEQQNQSQNSQVKSICKNNKIKEQIILPKNTKVLLANKIKEMSSKKPKTETDGISENQNVTGSIESKEEKKRKKRVLISPELIQRIKIIFEQYNNSIDKPYKERMTFRQISQHLSISMAEVKHLYDQYTVDPLFMNRVGKYDQNGKPKFYTSPYINLRTEQRLRFLNSLLEKRGPMTQVEIAQEMNKEEQLIHYDKHGKRIPITRKLVQYLMRLGNVVPKKLQIIQRNINTQDGIINRYKYCKRYLQITDDKSSDICFLGEFSFSNNLSLSSCPINKRDTFVDIKGMIRSDFKVKYDPKIEGEKTQDKLGRNLQYLLVMSLHGVIYYELFKNIFEQINFLKTLTLIGRAMNSRSPNHTKYLILETSFFHKKDDLHTFQKTSGIKIIFLPPQAPMMNPTEYLFNEIRQLAKSRVNKVKRAYSIILTEILQNYKDKNMQSYYACIRPYLELALRQQPFK